MRDGIVSVFLYALPIVLMFLHFYLRGEQPWKTQNNQSTTNQLNK